MNYCNPDYNGIMREGWICPRCGRVNAPWMPTCTCREIEVTYTKDTFTTAPTGKSYIINPNSYCNSSSVSDVDRDVKMFDNWIESLKRYEQYLKDDE